MNGANYRFSTIGQWTGTEFTPEQVHQQTLRQIDSNTTIATSNNNALIATAERDAANYRAVTAQQKTIQQRMELTSSALNTINTNIGREQTQTTQTREESITTRQQATQRRSDSGKGVLLLLLLALLALALDKEGLTFIKVLIGIFTVAGVGFAVNNIRSAEELDTRATVLSQEANRRQGAVAQLQQQAELLQLSLQRGGILPLPPAAQPLAIGQVPAPALLPPPAPR